ncbi:MAG TPA: hypothetical protein PLS50_08160 [Candidatus Dojkabacteria bacterium]|nr:hypothetical protein [Candidatus Dojkabacteria bacterium]
MAPTKVIYSFDSSDVTDSIILYLKKQEEVHQSPYQKVKWVALLRETAGVFELIITEKFGGTKSPINELLKKGNRFILVDNLKIPLFFESDILSLEMRKANVGSVNWGGYYFKIIKENFKYKVVETGVLF